LSTALKAIKKDLQSLTMKNDFTQKALKKTAEELEIYKSNDEKIRRELEEIKTKYEAFQD
jgi:predicted  nucleic acid-binding Zn-ribbon protein